MFFFKSTLNQNQKRTVEEIFFMMNPLDFLQTLQKRTTKNVLFTKMKQYQQEKTLNWFVSAVTDVTTYCYTLHNVLNTKQQEVRCSLNGHSCGDTYIAFIKFVSLRANSEQRVACVCLHCISFNRTTEASCSI